MPIKVSVIIASYNREKFISEALLSLFNQTIEATNFEVIVVDNNSTDHTMDICKDFIASHSSMLITYIMEPRQGASFARNTGAGLAKGEILCFMDDDAIAQPDFIEQVIEFNKLYPQVKGWGGKIIPKYIPKPPKWMSHYVSSLVGNFNYGNKIIPFSNNKYPLESNMAVLKNTFNDVGGFNTALPGVQGTLRIGGEGKDFYFKVKKIAPPIYYNFKMVVYHIVEVDKLTPEYMYRVASGIGRGERVRINQEGKWQVFIKFIEYLYKLGGSIAIGLYYLIIAKPAKSWPVIQFRLDVLKGFLEKR